jgi:hypothetical protein
MMKMMLGFFASSARTGEAIETAVDSTATAVNPLQNPVERMVIFLGLLKVIAI